METGIALIHGYTGSYSNLQPLADKLIKVYGQGSVKNIALPGHGDSQIPPFDEDYFIEHICKDISEFKKQNRKVVILGHSTGGNLVLACIKEKGLIPDYLILAGVPFKIDSGALERWNEHRKGGRQVPFSDVARMVSLINRTGKQDYIPEDFYSLIITGEKDRLVLPSDAYKWIEKFPDNKTRLVLVPDAEHDIFIGSNSDFTIDVILRTIEGAADDSSDDISEIVSAEPEVQDFITSSPFSKKHIARCPSGRRAGSFKFDPCPLPATAPVFANIEITTYCNFKCKFCARSEMGKKSRNMDLHTFRRILDLLPHAYRVTLVGLGEPLMHPEILDFITTAVSLKRRVGMVTNASLLDSDVSRELIAAGLHSIAFSLDTVNQDSAAQVRKGTDIEKVIKNIRQFIKLADAARPIAKAVFTALSVENLPYFNDLVDTVSAMGIDILMLTDLNFRGNIDKTIWKNTDEQKIVSLRNTVKKAFLNKLPVLTVHALEEFGLRSRYKDFLLLPPDQLYHRSRNREYCFSPWQTVPVDVEGNITMCDCQPDNPVGNILSEPFSRIWMGEKMTGYRKQMLSDTPPDTCKICPRF